ncbi:DUF86 domain-containing protein [bacterium]|nr:DUF86 domain-containing protein [bacterium]
MRDHLERLRDIIEAIEKIERYSCKGKEAFLHDELIQIWMIHHLEIIGEAGRSVSEGFHLNNTQIPWQKIVGMRNVLIHEYLGLDLEIIWQVISVDLPNLRFQIEGILKDQ